MKSPFTNPMLGMGTFPPSGPPITTTPLPTERPSDHDPGDEQPPAKPKETFRERALRRAREQNQDQRFTKEQEQKAAPQTWAPSCSSPAYKAAQDAINQRFSRQAEAYDRIDRARREYEAQVALSKAADSARQAARRLIEDQAIYGTGFTKVEVKATGSVEFRPTPMSEILAEARASEIDMHASDWTKFYTR